MKKTNLVILSPTARLVLEKRYLKKDMAGRVIETPEEMFLRVARNVAAADANYNRADLSRAEEEFFGALSRLEFMPNSPTLMNAGRELQQLAACFVLPVEDSIEQIFDAIKEAAIIHQSGGGTGFSFSRIRPRNDIVKTSGGPASGPISFMRVFNEATEAINQGGFRRGANMAILHVQHPDIKDFIHVKSRQEVLTNFNISVAVTDEFMHAVEENTEYEFINPRTGRPVKKLRAREVFEEIIDEAWKTGEPGMIFLDTINRYNPTPELGQIESTNPCGEQPLLPYESCVLGSISLAKIIVFKEGRPRIDWDKFKETVRLGVHFLDNVIDMSRYPLPQIDTITRGNRKIGLGVMGFADMLILLGIPYSAPEALEVAEELAGFLSREANQASLELAEKRGVFPNFHRSIYSGSGGMRVRNATRTTVAPAGTISIIAGCSSGIEPLFSPYFIRHILNETRVPEVHPIFKELAERAGIFSQALLDEIARRGSVQDIPEVTPEIKRLFVTARDVPATWHVKMQAAFQKYVDNAVSKTINFSPTAQKGEVREAFMLAYKSGCKGITAYRDRSRVSQALALECTVCVEESA